MSKTKTFLLLSYLCLASVSTAILSPALPAIMSTFAINSSQVTWVTSIFLIGYMLGQLLYAPLAKSFGAVYALRSGLSLMVAGIVLTIFAATKSYYNMLLVGRFITAIGAAGGLSCTFMLLKQYLSEQDAAKASAYGPFFFTMGIGIASYIGGTLNHHYHWLSCLYALLLYSGLMLGLTFQFANTHAERTPVNLLSTFKSYQTTLKNGRLVYFSFCVGFVSIVAYCYSTAAPLYAAQTLHINSEVYGQWNFVNMIGMALSSLLAAYILERKSHQILLQLAVLGLIPVILCMAIISHYQSASSALFFINSSLLYLFSGLMFPAGSYFALKFCSDHHAGSSMMSFINIGSAAIALIIMGYLPLTILVAYSAVLIGGFIVLIIGYIHSASGPDFSKP